MPVSICGEKVSFHQRSYSIGGKRIWYAQICDSFGKYSTAKSTHCADYTQAKRAVHEFLSSGHPFERADKTFICATAEFFSNSDPYRERVCSEHFLSVQRTLLNKVCPIIGHLPVRCVGVKEIKQVLIEARITGLAERTIQGRRDAIMLILRYACLKGWRDNLPFLPLLENRKYLERYAKAIGVPIDEIDEDTKAVLLAIQNIKEYRPNEGKRIPRVD